MIRLSHGLLWCLSLAGCSANELPNGRTRAGLISGYDMVLKAHDQSGDGRLSRAELVTMVDASLLAAADSSTGSSEMRDWVLRDYAAQDLDSDGYLSRDELLKEPLATFTCIDTDHDGSITDAEITSGMNRCPSRPGDVAS